MLGHDPRDSGTNPDAAGPGDSLAVAWHEEIGLLGGADGASTPVVGGGRLVVGLVHQVSSKNNDGEVAALDGDGDVVWSVDTPGPQVSPPVLVDDLAVHQTEEDGLVARSLEDGEVRWTRTPEPALPGRLLARDDELLTGTPEHLVLGLDASDGSERWRVEFEDEFPSTPLVGDDGRAVSVTEDRIVCFDLGGDVRWHREKPARSKGCLLAAETLLYGNLEQSVREIRALDPEDGEQQWNAPLPGENVGSFTATDDSLLVPANAAHAERDASVVVAYDLADGRRRWETNLEDDALFRAAATPSHAYVGTVEGRIHSLDLADGELVATVDTGLGDALRAPIVAGNHVYAGSTEGTVVAVD